MVAAGGHKVGAVGAEGAVPDPTLVAGEGGLERESPGLGVGAGGLHVLDLPNFGSVVGAAGSQLLDVRRKQNARDVLLVRREVGQGDKLGPLESLDKLPDEDIALWKIRLCNERRARAEKELTALLAAQRRVPLVATVTLDTETSSSGISWWAQVFSAKSQSRMLPPLSQLMISP